MPCACFSSSAHAPPLDLQGNVVQRTGNFAAISVLFGILLVLLGAALIAFKYLLQHAEKRHTQQDPVFWAGSNSDAGTSAAGAGVQCNTAVAARGPVPHMGAASSSNNSNNDHVAVSGADDVAAAADRGSLDAVVVLSAQDAPVRARAAAGSGQQKK
jgi:hypothetical protein